MRREDARVSRREDALLQGGAKLVVLRDGEEHFLRLLVPKEGRATFVTPRLPLALEELAALRDLQPYRLNLGGLTVRCEGNRAIVALGSFVMWGPRNHLVRAIEDVAR